jgi:hypothetical protein
MASPAVAGAIFWELVVGSILNIHMRSAQKFITAFEKEKSGRRVVMHGLLVSLLLSHQHSIEDMGVWGLAMGHTQLYTVSGVVQ